MNILIIGGGGLVGQKVARALAARGELRGKEISKITLADIVDPAPVEATFPVETVSCNITDPASVAKSLTAAGDLDYLATLTGVDGEPLFRDEFLRDLGERRVFRQPQRLGRGVGAGELVLP